MKKAVEQINDNNKKFAKGESSFEETLYPETILDEKEFAKEQEGRIPATARKTKLRNFGRINHPDLYPTKEENDAVLARIDAELDRSALPRSYDAREKGQSYMLYINHQDRLKQGNKSSWLKKLKLFVA